MAKRQSAPPAIDRDQLRAAIRRLGGEYVFYILDEALDILPAAKLAKIVGHYMDLKQLRPKARSADAPRKPNLLAEVRAFDADSRAGKYYESFNVNSKNFMSKSLGTQSFIADCRRLLDGCVKQAPKGDAVEIREAIEIVLGLLRHIDECNDDVIFFADEAGTWQVGIDWAKVLPALFMCLSRTTTPDEYARLAVAVVEEFDDQDRARHLAAARRLGSTAQRKALRDAGARLR